MLNVAFSVSPTAHAALATNSRPLLNRAFALAVQNLVEIGENCLRTEILVGAVAVGKDFTAAVHQDEARKAAHEIVLNGGFAPELLVIDRWPRHVGLSHISFHPER